MPGYTSANVPLAPTKSDTGKASSISRVSLFKGTSMPQTFVARVPCAGEENYRNTYPVRNVHTLAQERRSQRFLPSSAVVRSAIAAEGCAVTGRQLLWLMHQHKARKVHALKSSVAMTKSLSSAMQEASLLTPADIGWCLSF